MFKEPKETILKEVIESMTNIPPNENSNKKIEIIKRNKWKFWS